MLTEKQIEILKKELELIAGESLEVEAVTSNLYFYGSELATLRLLKKHREWQIARCGFSVNLNRFYFKLEM